MPFSTVDFFNIVLYKKEQKAGTVEHKGGQNGLLILLHEKMRERLGGRQDFQLTQCPGCYLRHHSNTVLLQLMQHTS